MLVTIMGSGTSYFLDTSYELPISAWAMSYLHIRATSCKLRVMIWTNEN